MRKIWLAGIGVAVAMWTATAWGEDAPKLPTVDEIMAKMKAKWAGMKSIELDANGTQVKRTTSTTTRHVAAERGEKDGKAFVRSVDVFKVFTEKPENKTEMAEFMNLNDGRFLWVEHRWPGGALEGWTVKKFDLDNAKQAGFKDILDDMPREMGEAAKQFNMKVVGEEVIKGQKMYVLEGTLDVDKNLAYSEKWWIGENDLLRWRSVTTLVMGKERMPAQTSDVISVKVNGKIDPKVFEYTPPAGAELEDMTKKETK